MRLTEEEFARTVERVRDRLARNASAPDPPAVAAAARAEGVVLAAADLLRLLDGVGAAVHGAGRLQPLLETDGVTDVLVNGGGTVWVDDGAGLRRAATTLDGEAEVRALAVRLAAGAGRRLDEASPFVDARLPDGTRLHALLPPLAPDGTHLSLRVPAVRRFGLPDLLRHGAVPGGWEPVLRALVERRCSFLVSGGTGSGKTTLLQALLGLVAPGERIVLVEDSGELRPDHPHVVRLEARHGNVEGRGAVGLDVLVRQALRMRPDRLVVGECRGAEVRDLLAALNTGHAGGAGTVHANTAADVPARLHALASTAGLTPGAVDAQVLAGIDVVLHVARRGGRRGLVEVAVVVAEAGRAVVVPALAAGGEPPGGRGPAPRPAGWDRLSALLDLPAGVAG
ncbi:TadA family conjugal transfer-associated ATPase [Kineococcus radiotolerans]|uniref:Type II secretion system protein E n=1 Tax=Kineococcus radiotolerans (strain ATCC BAA-149 / DSM 14245 / SRS30216) TaxID=266940 RepID=A6W578_KINRD|nr:TadA family conjugal transfer-associated ATPase [Kineococcus radiotolerans]ABS01967.1 type II secretion system protein E [Kineococcus radiotolerans SRS30216 = ATCC BAA-149]